MPGYLACPRTHLEVGVLGPEPEKEQPEQPRAGGAGAGSLGVLEAIRHLSRGWAGSNLYF